MSPTRPKKPTDPRAVTDSIAPSIQQAYPAPTRPLGEDLVDEVMRSHTEGPCELGEYRAEEDQSLRRPGRLGGKPRAIAFDNDWWDWFEKRSPEQRKALGWFAEFLASDPKRAEALAEMLDQYIEHGIVVRNRKKLIRSGAALAGGAWAVVVWGGDALEWAVGKIPAIKSLIALWKGTPS